MDVAAVATQEATSIEARVASLSNDALIIALLQTVNHLSRWLTPIHNRARLETAPFRSEQSLKDVLIGMRDNEAQVYSLMYAIANEVNPDLDRIPPIQQGPMQIEADRQSNLLVIMSGFRRVRQSSTSLLRALPDNAWERGGYSRTRRDWTIRQLAEALAANDWRQLSTIDAILERTGAREGIAEVSQVRLEAIDEAFTPLVGRG